MYAVVEIKGNQYKVEEGSVIKVDCLPNEEGKNVEFDRVLILSDENGVMIGNPYLTGVSVRGTVLGEEKGKKVLVFKFKKRKDYRKRIGHRQRYTRLSIDYIVVPGGDEARKREAVGERAQGESAPTS